jgi:hypothetical protein
VQTIVSAVIMYLFMFVTIASLGSFYNLTFMIVAPKLPKAEFTGSNPVGCAKILPLDSRLGGHHQLCEGDAPPTLDAWWPFSDFV